MSLDLHWPATLRWSPPDDPGLVLRRLVPDADAPRLHAWFSRPEARFWGMQDHDVDAVRCCYRDMLASGHALALAGECEGTLSFLVECYDPARDALAAHHAAEPGDLGMHFFVGPAEPRRHGFTRRVFRGLLRALFDRLGAARVVVEPDVRNDKVHALNAAMGFEVVGRIALPHKTALLSLCTRAQFVHRHPCPSPSLPEIA
jgi:RimJ/RimL family protein N-acetyltransferase